MEIGQLSDQATAAFDEIVRQDRITIDMSVSTGPVLLPAYVEDCRMKLWDNVFYSYFRGNEAFQKGHEFRELKGSDLIVRRVLYRFALFTSHSVCEHNNVIYIRVVLLLSIA